MIKVKVDYTDDASVQAFVAMHPSTLEDKNANRPLHLACYFGLVCEARQLIQDGAEVDALNLDGDTAFHCALYGRKSAKDTITILKLLISSGADVHYTRFGASYLDCLLDFWGSDTYGHNSKTVPTIIKFLVSKGIELKKSHPLDSEVMRANLLLVEEETNKNDE